MSLFLKEWNIATSSLIMTQYNRRHQRIGYEKINSPVILQINELNDSIQFTIKTNNNFPKNVFISMNYEVIVENLFQFMIVFSDYNLELQFQLIEDGQNSINARNVKEMIEQLKEKIQSKIVLTSRQIPTKTLSQSSNSTRMTIEDEILSQIPRKRKLVSFNNKENESNENKENVSSQTQKMPNKSIKIPSDPIFVSRDDTDFVDVVDGEGDDLTTTQQEVLNACLRGENVFFTGGAGTGKTVLLKRIISELNKKYDPQSIVVTATTGLAACAIGGVTVHQFGGIRTTREPLSQLSSSSSSSISSSSLNNRSNSARNPNQNSLLRRWQRVRVLIVDEISMMKPEDLEVWSLFCHSV